MEIEVFRKKLAAREAEQPQQNRGGTSLSVQIKVLQAALARGDYDKVQQMLGNLASYGLPPEYQEEWLQIVEQTSKELEKRRSESMDKWRVEVDQLVADTKKVCIEASTAADLDPLLVRCAALQMRREQQNNVLGERIAKKLTGVVNTLSAWTGYLDAKEAGNSKRANETLRNLRGNESGAPVLTVQEIESKFLQNDISSMDVRGGLAKIFGGVKSPDDLPAALERLKSLVSNPINPELSSLQSERDRLEAHLRAWEAAKAGDVTAALKTLERNDGGFENAKAYYEPLKMQILDRVMQFHASKWSQLTKTENEAPAAFLQRILDELLAKGDRTALFEALKFADQITPSREGTGYSKERTAIDQFLAAERFEKAGDFLAAASCYRSVVGSSAGKYAPIEAATEALKRIQTSHPEAVKSHESALLEEMRVMRQQMQMLMGRGPGGPHFFSR